ncbi:MAG: hypothetical protein ACE5JI_12390, partial [Acidobacteriota bacterium]
NWPDNYIHTSDDDLWNIDRTQLQRNAFAAAAIAYTIARAGDEEADVIAREVFARSSRRLAEAFDVATRLVREQPGRGRAFHLARNQIHQAVERETRALLSLNAVAPGRTALTQSLSASLEKIGQSLQGELEAFYRTVSGEKDVPSLELTEKEKELQGLTPQVVAGPAEFLEGRGEVQNVEGLHRLMAFEITNYIDGKRTALEIYEAAVAEALQGGADYYGTISPDQVSHHLDNLAAAGLVKLSRSDN